MRFIVQRSMSQADFAAWLKTIQAASESISGALAFAWSYRAWTLTSVAEMPLDVAELRTIRIFSDAFEIKARMLFEGDWRVVVSGDNDREMVELLPGFESCEDFVASESLGLNELIETQSERLFWGQSTASDNRIIERQIPQILEIPQSGHGRPRIQLKHWLCKQSQKEIWSRWSGLLVHKSQSSPELG